MNEPVIAGLFGLLGAFFGALLPYWFNRLGNKESRHLQLKTEAYADFVNCVASLTFASTSDRAKALEKLTAAKGRLCVFGDKDVINAAMVFDESSANLVDQNAQYAFIQLLQAMRRSGIPNGNATDHALKVILLGNKSAQQGGAAEAPQAPR